MKQLLVYGDSLSWGIDPGTRNRHPFGTRWPTVLELGLREAGHDVRVLEDCLNGRRTVFEDPFNEGRRGLTLLGQTMEKHAPLAGVLLMLGTNDFQSMHPHNAWHASRGVALLIQAMRSAPIEPGMPVPPILLIAPPPITQPAGAIAPKFLGGEQKCVGLAASYAALATETGVAFFDAGRVVTASPVDGVHLDAPSHVALGRALIPAAAALLA
jgi:lysophospholipase L1-like esterase